MAVPKQAVAKAPGLLQIGDKVHLVSGGRTLTNYEVLDMDDKFLKLSANSQVAPQTDAILLPWTSIEVLGLPNG